MRQKHEITLSLILIAGIFWTLALGAQESPTPWETAPVQESNPSFDAGYGQFVSSAGKFDRNADGRMDLVVTDRNVDARADYWATDRNFDGIIDDYQYDRNFDGRVDQWEYDYDGDGMPDKIYVDASSDGVADMYAEFNPVTRTYVWLGGEGNRMNMGKIRSKKRLAKGRAAFSE